MTWRTLGVDGSNRGRAGIAPAPCGFVRVRSPTSHRDVGCPHGNLTPGGSRLQFPYRRQSPSAIMPGGGAGRRVSTECPRRHRDGWRVIESIVCPPATCGRVTAGESSKSSGLLDNSTTCQKPVTAHHGRVEKSIWALVETYSQKAPEGPCRVKRRGSGGVPSELDIDRTAASPLGRCHTNVRWRV